MSTLKVAALAVALSGGIAAFAPADAQAQGYGYGRGHYQPHYGYAPQPQYVHPKILRKQAQLEARFHQKFGYAQPQYGYGYGRPYGHGYGHQYGHGYGHRQVQTYTFGW
jgi:hypothetical protein